MRYSIPVLRKNNGNSTQYPVCGRRISPWPPGYAAEVLNNAMFGHLSIKTANSIKIHIE